MYYQVQYSHRLAQRQQAIRLMSMIPYRGAIPWIQHFLANFVVIMVSIINEENKKHFDYN